MKSAIPKGLKIYCVSFGRITARDEAAVARQMRTSIWHKGELDETGRVKRQSEPLRGQIGMYDAIFDTEQEALDYLVRNAEMLVESAKKNLKRAEARLETALERRAEKERL